MRVGDELLSVDGVGVVGIEPERVALLLQDDCNDIVTLKIRRQDPEEEELSNPSSPSSKTPKSLRRSQSTVQRRNENEIWERLSELSDNTNSSNDPWEKRKESCDEQLREVERQIQTVFRPTPVQLERITVKRLPNEPFGFSLSDGVYEKGVYISAIKPNSPASGTLKVYDRILQINETSTRLLDCRQVACLLARCNDEITLIVCRNPLTNSPALMKKANEKFNSKSRYFDT